MSEHGTDTEQTPPDEAAKTEDANETAGTTTPETGTESGDQQ